MVTKSEILQIWRKLPTEIVLTQYGDDLGARSLFDQPSVDKANVEANADVFDSKQIDQAVQEFSKYFKRTRGVIRQRTSYGWKHVLERKEGVEYISKGDMKWESFSIGFSCF